MPKISDESAPRDQLVTLRLTQEEAEVLEEVARMNGMTKSTVAALAVLLGVNVLGELRTGGVNAAAAAALREHNKLIREGKAAPVRRRASKRPAGREVTEPA